MHEMDFNQQPYLVVWECTRACMLACRHCRAASQPRRHPQELTTEEGRRFIEQVARAKPGIFIITGGDPAQRPDFKEMIACGAQQGLRVAFSPSATPKLLGNDFKELKSLGVARMSLSVDGACAETHNAFRGVAKSWDWTMEAIARAQAAELPLQINSTFTRRNIAEFDLFPPLLERIKPATWSVFLLVPTGRGKVEDLLTGQEIEELFERLYVLSQKVPYPIKTTEGQHYRRVILQHSVPQASSPAVGAPASSPALLVQASSPAVVPHVFPSAGQAGTPAVPPGAKPSPFSGSMGVNDGKGFVFVSHVGDICPSGFLPYIAGNVRRDELIEVYRNSPIFRELRDSSLLKGKCGRCEFKDLCGGSRARAYAMTGDHLAEEPFCVYQPK
ncbi:MAG: TIGR04053 family radical SAM/SPASM domain-containing protein [Planctomycetota bacterium]